LVNRQVELRGPSVVLLGSIDVRASRCARMSLSRQSITVRTQAIAELRVTTVASGSTGSLAVAPNASSAVAKLSMACRSAGIKRFQTDDLVRAGTVGLDGARRQSPYFARGFVLVKQLHTSILLRKICSVNSRSRILRNPLQKRECGD
jgi:hypothetical protein